MPTRVTTPRVVPVPVEFQTQVTAPSNAATADTRNTSEGGTDLVAIEVDNMLEVTGNTKVWLKLYDDATSAWTPGTSAPVFVMPVPQVIAAAD